MKYLNKIIQGDCLDVMNKMPSQSIDLVITSPPYDDLRDYKNKCMFNFTKVSQQLYRIIKKGGVVVWIVGDQTVKGSETGTSFKQALGFKDVGFNLFDTMIYLKPPRGAVGNNKTYWQSFEYMFVLSKGNPKTINLLRDRENKEARKGDNGTKRLRNGTLKQLKRGGYSEYGRRTNVWQYNIGKGHTATDNFARQHPATFPEKLAEDHLLSWSNEKEIVYDPFVGSGTVAKMCIINNRYYIGSDISSEYCRLAEMRLRSVKCMKLRLTSTVQSVGSKNHTQSSPKTNMEKIIELSGGLTARNVRKKRSQLSLKIDGYTKLKTPDQL